MKRYPKPGPPIRVDQEVYDRLKAEAASVPIPIRVLATWKLAVPYNPSMVPAPKSKPE